MKTVGIIGGLGPETTSEFYLDIIFGTYKQSKEQRPGILISSVPLPYQIEADLIEKGKKYLGVLGDSVYMYAKLSFDISEDNLTVEPYAFRIQNFNVPAGITKMVADVGSSAIEDRLSQVPNVYIELLKQVGDKLNFSGTIPETLSVED